MKRLANRFGRNLTSNNNNNNKHDSSGGGGGGEWSSQKQHHPATPPTTKEVFVLPKDEYSTAADHCSMSEREEMSLPAFDTLYNTYSLDDEDDNNYYTTDSALSYKKEPHYEQQPHQQHEQSSLQDYEYDLQNVVDPSIPVTKNMHPTTSSPLACQVPDLAHSPIDYQDLTSAGSGWSSTTPESSSRGHFVSPSYSSSDGNNNNNGGEDLILLRQQLRDAHQVVKAVLDIPQVDRYDANKAVRKVQSSKKELLDLRNEYQLLHSQRQELETLLSQACLEKEQQQHAQSFADRRSGNSNDPHAAATTSTSTTSTSLQELLDERQQELVRVQLELRQLQSFTKQQQPEMEEMQQLQQQLETANCEIDELEQERQLNMTEIVDLHKQLRTVQQQQQGTMTSSSLSSSAVGNQQEFQEMKKKLQASKERMEQMEKERLLQDKLLIQVEATLEDTQAKFAHHLKHSTNTTTTTTNNTNNNNDDRDKILEATLAATLIKQERQSSEQMAILTEEIRALKSKMQDVQLDADQWELEAAQSSDRILKMAHHIGAKHKRVKTLEEENTSLKQQLQNVDEYEQHLAAARALHRKSQRRVSMLEDQLGAGQPCRPGEQQQQPPGVVPISPSSSLSPVSSSDEHEKVVKDLTVKLTEVTNQLDSCNEAVDTLSKELVDAHAKESDLSAQVATMEETMKELRQKQQSNSSSSSNATVGNRLSEGESLDLEMKLRASKWTIAKLQSQLADTSVEIEEKKHELGKEQRTNVAETQRLSKELEDSQARVQMLETQFQRYLRKEPLSESILVTNKSIETPPPEPVVVDPTVEELRAQLHQKDESLRQKQEAYTMQVDQVDALREQLHEALMKAESMEHERNFSHAKAEELSRLAKMDGEEDLIAEKLRQKAVQCAELELMLQSSEQQVAESHNKIEKLQLERGFNQTKIAELSTIWDDHLKADAIQEEQKNQIDSAARKVVASQEKLQQLELEKDGSVAKATSLSLKLAESLQKVDELNESLEMEKQANQHKDKILVAAGIDVSELLEDDNNVRKNRFRSFVTRMRKANTNIQSNILSHSMHSATGCSNYPNDFGDYINDDIEEEEGARSDTVMVTPTPDADKAAGTEDCSRMDRSKSASPENSDDDFVAVDLQFDSDSVASVLPMLENECEHAASLVA